MRNSTRPLRYASRSTDGGDVAAIAALRARLAGHERKTLPAAGARAAAVLAPIVSTERGLELLCFERTHEVLEHKGEICLPGGSLEPADDGVVSAALREAYEELGIAPNDVEVLGVLDDVHTVVSGYVITPVVGFLGAPPQVVIDALEVARPISVPLALLLEEGVESYELRAPDGTERTIYAYQVGPDRIWGATARIIHNLLMLWFGSEER